MPEVQRTPLAEHHESYGAKMVDFAGWWMPIEFDGAKAEHLRTRATGGLFDVSHMGEIRIQGTKALETVEWLTTNHVAKLQAGEAHYTLLSNDQGGVVDDLIIYCMEPGVDYLLCVNAANKDKDLKWIQDHNKGADIIDESDRWGQIAIQGPIVPRWIDELFAHSFTQMKPFTFQRIQFEGTEMIVAATGYTGEAGFEIFVSAEKTLSLWNQLVEEGKGKDIRPVGLAARDSLRTEMVYSLYGHEIDDTTNPYAARLGWVVKPKEKDFLGKDKILAAKEAGLTHQLVAFKVTENKRIPRQGYSLFSFDNEEMGRVTSGTLSPSLDEAIGIGYVKKEFSAVDTEFLVDMRGRKIKARVVKPPFVTPGGAN